MVNDKKNGVCAASCCSDEIVPTVNPAVSETVAALVEEKVKKTAVNGNGTKDHNPSKKSGSIEKIKEKINQLRSKVFYVDSEVTEKGLLVSLKRGAQENKFAVTMPEEVWSKFPHSYKLMLRDNLAHLSSMELAIMLKAKKINYNTPTPAFKSFFNELLLKCLLYSGDCDS